MMDELPGLSVFYKDEDGNVFHTYSTYARGLDILLGTYNFLDLVPKGRDENPESTMDWVRRHDQYSTLRKSWLQTIYRTRLSSNEHSRHQLRVFGKR
jgi:predicted dithiol-disulfide oxidoreductase (DUF899 family)